jgi:hypothetical protein
VRRALLSAGLREPEVFYTGTASDARGRARTPAGPHEPGVPYKGTIAELSADHAG